MPCGCSILFSKNSLLFRLEAKQLVCSRQQFVDALKTARHIQSVPLAEFLGMFDACATVDHHHGTCHTTSPRRSFLCRASCQSLRSCESENALKSQKRSLYLMFSSFPIGFNKFGITRPGASFYTKSDNT